jgi:hypothetical protein
VIVSELSLPPEARTIKPSRTLGGFAGGEKYVLKGIIFKFAVDQQGSALFGGDDGAAAKVAGLELQGLAAYSSLGLEELHFPLMCLLDLRGFRLLALSVLPIDASTLRYGSPDGGRTILCGTAPGCEALEASLERAARMLNLASHYCQSPQGPPCLLHAACDLEAHLARDRRFYLLWASPLILAPLPPPSPLPLAPLTSLQRLLAVFPSRHSDLVQAQCPAYAILFCHCMCECISDGGHGAVYERLRPEFVRTWPQPLSPDAYSRLASASDVEAQNAAVDAASEYLERVLVPRVAFALAAEYARAAARSPHHAEVYLADSSLSTIIHSFGT